MKFSLLYSNRLISSTDTHRIGVACFLAVLAMSYWRLYFGLDCLDEGSHLAYSQTFAQGRIPFLEERDGRQTMALLLSPLVKIYTTLFGFHYLALFLRHVAFGIALATALMVVGLRRQLGNRVYIGAAWLMAFVPASMMSFNYQRHTFLGLIVSSLLLHKTPLQKRPVLGFIGAQLTSMMVVVLYPPLIIPIAALNLTFLRCYGPHFPSSTRKNFIRLLIAAWAMFTILAIQWVMRHGGWDSIREILSYHHSIGHGGAMDKLLQILSGFRFFARFFATAGVGTLWLYLLLRNGSLKNGSLRNGRWFLSAFSMVLFLIPFNLGWNIHLAIIPCLWGMLLASLSLPLLFDRQSPQLPLIRLLCIPSVIAGILFGWVSSAAFTPIAYGLAPAALSWILLAPRQWPSLKIFATALSLIALGISTYCHVQFFPLDKPSKHLTHKFSSGTFAGIYTSPGIFHLLTELTSDLDAVSKTDSKTDTKTGSILFFYDFPAGYLLTTLKPNTPSTCLLSPMFLGNPAAYQRYGALYYRHDASLPTVIVQMLKVPSQNGHFASIPYNETSPLLKRLDFPRNYALTLSRDSYRIWTRLESIRFGPPKGAR